MGEWQDDARHGAGIIVTLDSMYFEGSFINNKVSVRIFWYHLYFERSKAQVFLLIIIAKCELYLFTNSHYDLTCELHLPR